MGKAQRDKGKRGELDAVHKLKNMGIHAERVPLSGASAYKDLKHDVTLYHPEKDAIIKAEVKVRGTGFKQIYDWLGDNDILLIKSDRNEWLVVQPLKNWRPE